MTKKRKLKHQTCSLTETRNGYVISSPAPRGLVISGGGAKGLAYAGMFQAMDDRGLIKQLTHVGGASAGAMTSSLLAVGMSTDTILKISTQLDITKLLDNKNLLSRAEGTRLRNVLELLYVFQIHEHLSTVEKPESIELLSQYSLLKQKIRTYDHVLKSQSIVIKSIDDILTLANNNRSLKKLDEALTYLPEQMKDHQGEVIDTPKITFKDLTRLRNLLPEDQKHLIKHLSVVTTNQTKQEIETYNEDFGCDSSIAEKVQQSGAHPVLFKPVMNAQGHLIADGGIKNNMPTKALENAGLKPEEILCAKAESGSKFAERLSKVKNHSIEAVSELYHFIDDAITEILGGRVFEARAKVLNREKIFYQLGNMLYLNTGEITTTTTAPTELQRAIAIETAYQQTLEFIDGRTKTFDNALVAMLYLGIDKLDHALMNTEQSSQLFVSAGLVKRIFLLQNAIVDELNKNQWDSPQEMIEQIEATLKDESGLTEEQQNQAFALCLKQINYFSAGTLEQYIIDQIKQEQGPEVSWFTHLLELLWKPIEWVLSLCSNPAPEKQDENKLDYNPGLAQDEPVITALKVLSFLSYKETKQSDVPNEEQCTKNDEQNKSAHPK
jgi:VPS inhibitor protein D